MLNYFQPKKTIYKGRLHHELQSPYFDSLICFIEPKMSLIKRNEKLQEKSLYIYEVLPYEVSCFIYTYSFVVFRTSRRANSAVEFAP